MTASMERQELWRRAIEPLERGDMAGALFRLRKLPKDDFPAAFEAMGKIYEIGGGGVTRDYERARKCYERALHKRPLVLAFLGLGRLYYFGWGVERDLEKARRYYEQVEEHGEPVALLMLGHIHLAGGNLSLAKEYYRRSAERGNLVARRHLAGVYLKEGRLVRGILAWVKAIFNILPVAVRDRRDLRLRMF